MFTANDLDFTSDGLDRLPPQNIEAEEVILGGILLDPEAITRVCDRLPAKAFYISEHKRIYEVMLSLHQENKPTDLLSVTSQLTNKIDPVSGESHLKLIGGRNKLGSLVDRTVSAASIDYLAELVYEKYLRRELIRISHRNIKLAYSTEIELPKILEEAQKSVFDLTQSQSDERPELLHVSVAMQEMYSDMEKKLSGEVAPIQSGFYDLDALTSGFEPNQFIVIGGRPAMGKTAIGVDIAWNIASKQNNQHKPVFFFSLEMDRRQLARRLTTRLSGVEGARLKTPKIMSSDDWIQISMAMETSEESKLYICDHSQMDMFGVTGSIRRLIARTGQKPGAIFVDHIHILADTEEDAKDEQLKISRASRFLKILSSESKGFGCPVFGLAQLNRAVESRQNKRPMLSDLRSSGSLEQDADFVFLLYRDEYYNPETPDRGIGEVIVAKGRDSGTGTIKLLYDAPMAQFKNLAKPQY